MSHHVQVRKQRLGKRSTKTTDADDHTPGTDVDDRTLLWSSLATLLIAGLAGRGIRGQVVSPGPGSILDELLRTARAASRTLYLYLGPCDPAAISFMERTVWSDTALTAVLSRAYVVGRVDAESEAGKAIARKYELDRSNGSVLPYHLFIAPSGEILHRTRGPEGNVGHFASILARAAENALLEDGQYYALRQRYIDGERGDDLLLKYAEAAREAHADEAQQIALEYVHALETIDRNNATTAPGMSPPGSDQAHDHR